MPVPAAIFLTEKEREGGSGYGEPLMGNPAQGTPQGVLRRSSKLLAVHRFAVTILRIGTVSRLREEIWS